VRHLLFAGGAVVSCLFVYGFAAALMAMPATPDDDEMTP
jgi:hypothetical protein